MKLLIFVPLILNVAHGLDETLTQELGERAAAFSVLFPWVVEVLGVLIFFLLKHWEIPVPYAACMFLIGVFMGSGAFGSARQAGSFEELDQLTVSIISWSKINSSVLLLVFLPGLIFRDALEVNFRLFSVAFKQLVILAFPMVLIGTILTATAAYFVLPYGLPLSLTATMGAILASTDPVAVGSVLKKAGAPPRLQLHISGESLLNDGSAVVFFAIFSQMYFAQLGFADEIGWGEGVVLFVKMSLGGVAVGLAFAVVLLGLLYELDRRLEPEYAVLQVVVALTVAYLSYYVSEQVCGMSGVIACVATGIAARALGRGMISNNEMMDSYLALMEFLLNTLLFALGGVVWGKVLIEKGLVVRPVDVGYLMILYLLVTAIRFVQVALIYPLFSRFGLGSNIKESVFLSFAGLRGAVGIALALSLTRTMRETTSDRDLLAQTEIVEFLAGGVTLLTLFVNGTLAAYVLRELGLAKPTLSRKRAWRLFKSSATAFINDEYRQLLQRPKFQDTDHKIIKSCVLFVTEEPLFMESETATIAEEDDGSVAHPITSTSCPDEQVADLRQLFLEIMKDVYSTDIFCDELLNEENGNTLDQLEFGADSAMADITSKKQLQDWEYVSDALLEDDFDSGVMGWLRNSPFSSSASNPECCKHTLRKRRNRVLRALAFIEAHHAAEKRLRFYVERAVDSSSNREGLGWVSENALDVVLAESSAQVLLAKETLNKYGDQVESIKSYYLSSILLHRLANFIEQYAKNGLLTKKEAQTQLAKIKKRMQVALLGNTEPKHSSGATQASDNSIVDDV